MTKLTNPTPLFLDARGSLMDGGQIYIGVANADPQTRPINLFWDFTQTVPAAQPLRTIGGRIVNGITPANIFFTENDFSMRVLDSGGSLVDYSPTTYIGTSFQPLDQDLSTISGQTNTEFGLQLLTLANGDALQSATGAPDCIPTTGGTTTGNIIRSGAGAHFYGANASMTGAKIYPPLPIGTANPATGAGSIQGFY